MNAIWKEMAQEVKYIVKEEIQINFSKTKETIYFMPISVSIRGIISPNNLK